MSQEIDTDEMPIAEITNIKNRKAMAADDVWKSGLLLNEKGIMKPKSLENAVLFLTHHGSMRNKLFYDEFARKIYINGECPWDNRPATRVITDADEVKAKQWLETQGLTLSVNETNQAILSVATDNAINPLKEYLNNLKWDGKDRCTNWLNYYMGAEDNDYCKLIGRKFLIGAVARALDPGCQVDTMLILEGPQGKRKSSAIAALFGRRWFTDELSELGSKDAAQQLQGRWAVEISELEALRRSEATAIKAWLTRRIDIYRPAYGRNVIEAPRTCVLVGTTNAATYLHDETGARRFWPILIKQIDIEAILADRDQLWAEAVAAHNTNERWWLDEDEQSKIAAPHQKERYVSDAWAEKLDNYLKNKDEVSVNEIMDSCLFVPTERQNQSVIKRVSNHLIIHGWKRFRKRYGDQLKWKYRRINND